MYLWLHTIQTGFGTKVTKRLLVSFLQWYCNYYNHIEYIYFSCSHYQIAVVYLPDGVLPEQLPDVLFPQLNSFLTYDQVQRNTSRVVAYIAAEFSEALFPANGQFVIGDRNQPKDQPSMYTNAPLQTGKNYTFFLRIYSVDCNVSTSR